MTLFNTRKLYQKYKLHLLVWSLYIVYEVFILGLVTNSFRQPAAYLVVYLVSISTFYIYALALEKILRSDTKSLKFLKITLLIVAMIFAYVISTYILILLFEQIHLIAKNPERAFDKAFILSCIYRSLLYIGYATGYVYILKSFSDQKRVEALERQNLITQIEKQALETDLVQSQNNFLRSQINPHFLFNTLNFIYNDARKKAPMAADAIMNLSEMMRYALKRPEVSELVPLSEEVEQIEHLINLHQLRTANTVNISLEINGDLFGLRFPPLILLTLVENMFKHGNVSHSTQAALIRIEYSQSNLNISTINMVNDNKGKEHESHHVGLENITKRLNNFYKDDYIFRYYKDPLNRYITEIDVTVSNPLAKLNSFQ
ncbi:sensor histidine kinase [Pedobacter sandarakinus]|uniref:sensor histidine kinase n=1 Tax=Pedobacter sandarakinus TaxID=353156 RepID=UPI0022462C4D|nr:sensor histidine kinase [Pedobacter sandarakinus]MCX2573271.1 sensor histidine kinase [Pedobacter sandarakinus]